VGIPYTEYAERPELTDIEQVVPREHTVLFYSSDSELRRSAGTYLSEALLAGSVAVVIASASHQAMLEQEITAAGHDLGALRSSGSWIALDAVETLDRLVVDGRPDPGAFDSVVGRVIVGATEQGRPVCAYGEMVALLWQSHQINAALDLEGLWNDLGERTPFSLLCSYATSSLSDPSLAPEIEAVCSQHSGVVDSPFHRAHRESVHRSVRVFPATPDAVTHARRFVADTAREWGLAQIAEDVQLIASELAGNTIRHAHSEFSVAISKDAASLRVAVADRSHTLPEQRRPANSSNSGRGLILVTALSTKWGFEPSAEGKVVWAELQL
jgi:anti-sigma regulatory factor (Ser/Thr protein kinase)